MAAALLIAVAAIPARAQLTLGVTGGTVTYEQASATQSLGISPEFRLERRGLVLDLAAGYTSGSDGTRAFDGSGTFWRSTAPFAGHFRLDGLLQAAATHPHLDSSSVAALEFGELTWAGEGGGVGLGAGAAQGKISGTAGVNALRTGARGWLDVGSVEATASIQPTRLVGAWYTDITGGLATYRRLLDVSATARARRITGSPTSVGADASVAWHAQPRATVEVAGGRRLRDPLQGLPAGSFITLGFRWLFWNPHGGLGEGESETDLGDVQVAAAQSLGFAQHGNNSNRGTTTVPSSRGSGSGNSTTGRGHKP